MIQSPPPFRKTAGLAHEIAQFIREAISDGRLSAGEKLPAEQMLAGEFGVSRSVVREAMSQLRFEGLVRSHRGIGLFVSDTGISTSFVIDAIELEEPAVLSQLFELRMSLEADAAVLAASRRQERHVEELNASLRDLEAALGRGEDGAKEEIIFRRVIADAAGNTYFTSLVQIITDKVRIALRTPTGRVLRPRPTESIYAEHEAIYQAIANHEPKRAHQAVRRHLGNTASHVGIDVDDIWIKNSSGRF